MARRNAKTQRIMERVMHEFKTGELESGGSHQPVTRARQAVAIGLNEARRAGAPTPPAPRRGKKAPPSRRTR